MVAQIADRVLVLRDGAMVELATTGDIIATPTEAYTRDGCCISNDPLYPTSRIMQYVHGDIAIWI